MKRLGYKKFVAQGGDWGAIVTELMVTGATGRSCAPVWALAILSSTSSPEVRRPKIV